MFRSRVKQRRIFSNRRQSRRRFSWLNAIATVVLLLLAAELLTRIFVDLAGERELFTQAEVESEIEEAYQLISAARSSELDDNPDALLAKSSLSVGYELVGGREGKYWQINPQGFRDGEPISPVKPKDEIRIFLLGNSTAFGYGNSSNSATIGEQLEQRLQQRLQQQQASPQLYRPEILPQDKAKRQKSLAKPAKIQTGKYRVINAAIPGYASGNELALLALKILQYQPDAIVVMDGYMDLMLPSDEKATTLPATASEAGDSDSLGTYLNQAIATVENNSYLIKIVQNNWFNSSSDEPADFLLEEKTSNLVRHLPTDELELQNRIERYLEHQKQILGLCAAAQAPLIVAIQPEISGRNPSQLSNAEGETIAELGRTYIDRVRESYPAFIKASQQLAKAYPQNLKVVDLYHLTDKYPSPSFIDAIHLNDSANNKVAEQLYYAIASLPKMQVVPPQPATETRTSDRS